MPGKFLAVIRVLFIYLLATPCGMWDLSSVTRDEPEPPAWGVWSPTTGQAGGLDPTCSN